MLMRAIQTVHRLKKDKDLLGKIEIGVERILDLQEERGWLPDCDDDI